ncbi:MAG: histidine kinase [Dehalococcoidia bacterium]
MANEERIKELEEKIRVMRERIPPHSIPPAMLEELEDLEEELERLKKNE